MEEQLSLRADRNQPRLPLPTRPLVVFDHLGRVRERRTAAAPATFSLSNVVFVAEDALVQPRVVVAARFSGPRSLVCQGGRGTRCALDGRQRGLCPDWCIVSLRLILLRSARWLLHGPPAQSGLWHAQPHSLGKTLKPPEPSETRVLRKYGPRSRAECLTTGHNLSKPHPSRHRQVHHELRQLLELALLRHTPCPPPTGRCPRLLVTLDHRLGQVAIRLVALCTLHTLGSSEGWLMRRCASTAAVMKAHDRFHDRQHCLDRSDCPDVLCVPNYSFRHITA